MDKEKEISLPEVLTVVQPQGKALYPAEYRANQSTIYLRDVIANGQHYQAALQLQNGQFVLTAANPISNSFTQAAQFDATSNLLSIPLAKAFGQAYQATLKHRGNFMFSLENAALR